MKYSYSELTKAREDMRSKSELYRPTAFWDGASAKIENDLCENGIENFRSLTTTLGYFVPNYGMPTNGFSPEQTDGLNLWLRENHSQAIKPQLALQQFLNGSMSALADYRVLLAADDTSRLPHLHTFSESVIGTPLEQHEIDGRRFSRSSLNYLLGLAMLKKHLPADYFPQTVLEIGGGFGTLGEILCASGIENLRYIDIDIPPTSFVAQWYLSQIAGKDSVTGYAETHDIENLEISELKRLSVLCAWQIERLRGRVDLFVNFISFQEMEPHVVKNYLSHVARLETKWVLLRNLREGKQKRQLGLSNLGVDEPIMGDDYCDMLPDYELVERSVHPYGYRTVDGFHSELLLLRRK